jgi:hypothetical protein
MLHRFHITRLNAIETHAAADSSARRTMVSRDHSLADAAKTTAVNSNVRMHRASDLESGKFLWSRDAITEPERATMEESVEIFLAEFKYDHAAIPQFPEKVCGNVYPELEVALPPVKAPRKLSRVFDGTGYYDLKQTPLSIRLPPLAITAKLKDFVGEDGQDGRTLLGRVPAMKLPRGCDVRRGRARSSRPSQVC